MKTILILKKRVLKNIMTQVGGTIEK